MIDHQQRAAGERPEEYATKRESTDYWLDVCYDILNRARLAEGKPPYVRRDRS